ncbi:MAG: hypothetical protein EOO88_13870 [Pedobacter sp.]|nr:MAG: hypothetical protein EOO88_13870 [Pedobacter sp.]
MNSTRLNVFNQIHKGLRALLFDTAILMQQTDFGNSQQAEPVLAQTELLLSMFDAHAQHEDSCILECAHQHNPGLIGEFESEHQTDLVLSSQLAALIDRYRAAGNEDQRYAVGTALLHALFDFIAFNLKHMSKEEKELNMVLWDNYNDREIMQMEHRIQQLIPPDKLFIYFKWMIRGLNNIEVVQWLIAVKNGAPEVVFNGLLEECRVNLPAERWRLIQSLLSEGSLR